MYKHICVHKNNLFLWIVVNIFYTNNDEYFNYFISNSKYSFGQRRNRSDNILSSPIPKSKISGPYSSLSLQIRNC